MEAALAVGMAWSGIQPTGATISRGYFEGAEG